MDVIPAHSLIGGYQPQAIIETLQCKWLSVFMSALVQTTECISTLGQMTECIRTYI